MVQSGANEQDVILSPTEVVIFDTERLWQVQEEVKRQTYFINRYQSLVQF